MAFGTNNDDDAVLPTSSKRARVQNSGDSLPKEFIYCQKLLVPLSAQSSSSARSSSSASPSSPSPPKDASRMPTSLTKGGKTRNSLAKVRSLMDSHGLRTSLISSPREALSVYKDSCKVECVDDSCLAGKTFLVTMFGLHPHQSKLEGMYTTCIKRVYCLLLFCQRLREICPAALKDNGVADLLSENELRCISLGRMVGNDPKVIQKAISLSETAEACAAELICSVVQAESRYRSEQLYNEYNRIAVWNCTLSNALVTIFMKEHQCLIKDMFFKRSHQPKFERITIYFYDPDNDQCKPPHFMFLPSVNTALELGEKAVVHKMIASFWSNLLRNGYFATRTIRETLDSDLIRFFLSGIGSGKTPLQLNAHFTPQSPLSFYFHGKAGAGKSSFVRNFQPALEATIEAYLDPEIRARFVKQNLNKPLEALNLELELRPNNNDLSVMSIILSRRMTRTQRKPGLVVINLEEMPSNNPQANPNQLKVSQLISQRFGGRDGAYKAEEKTSRSSDKKRGIDNDASLITLLTSNYPLDPSSVEALRRLQMFQHLQVVEMEAVTGLDRSHFAKSYLEQCIRDRFETLKPKCDIDLDIPTGQGDTRPLVRHLRMIAFYISSMVADRLGPNEAIKATVTHPKPGYVLIDCKESMDLKIGTMENLFPLTPQYFEPRVKPAVDALAQCGGISPSSLPSSPPPSLPASIPSSLDRLFELSIILQFWIAKTLAPTVIISTNKQQIDKIMAAIQMIKSLTIQSITNVNADEYKIMKSLYDANDTPNLRDDILKLVNGGSCSNSSSSSNNSGSGVGTSNNNNDDNSGGRRCTSSSTSSTYVAIQLTCPSRDSQLCVREIIEDSPSMTAFSTAKSALYKSGLLFAIYIPTTTTDMDNNNNNVGATNEITPEIRSRASIIL